jgi:acetyltransferase-like isoleucine patch superfamily enzyme
MPRISVRGLLRKMRVRLLKLRHCGAIVIGDECFIDTNAQFLPSRGRIRIGNYCEIRHGSIIETFGGSVSLGMQCSLNPYSIIYGPGPVQIGNYVRIAAHTVIVANNHSFDDLSAPIKKQGNVWMGIEIGDNVWIGANCVILDGARIASGTVIAAGSVVKGKTVPNGVYAGVPAKFKRLRGSQTVHPDLVR